MIEVGLSIKQEKFCLEYAKLGNARQAYINAGYSFDKSKPSVADVNACRLLKNAKVKARLEELAEEAKNDAIADIQEMQEVLTKIIRQQATEEVVMLNCLGTFEKTKKQPAIKEVISAIEKLGKMQGAFKEKVELDVAIPVFAGEDELEE